MANEELTKDVIKELLANNQDGSTWPDYTSTLTVARAVAAKREYVILYGRRFKIRYETNYEAIFIKPADEGFTPCGYLSLEKLETALKDHDE